MRPKKVQSYCHSLGDVQVEERFSSNIFSIAAVVISGVELRHLPSAFSRKTNWHKFTTTPTQGAAEDRGSLAALDRELQQLSSTDVRQATLQVTDGRPLLLQSVQ